MFWRLEVWSHAFFRGCAPWLIDGFFSPPHVFASFFPQYLSSHENSRHVGSTVTGDYHLYSYSCFKDYLQIVAFLGLRGENFCMVVVGHAVTLTFGCRERIETSTREAELLEMVTSQCGFCFCGMFCLWGRLHCFALPCAYHTMTQS